MIYNIGISCYGLLICIASIFSTKASKRLVGGRRALKFLRNHIDPKARYIWVHVASLGEFEQGRPLIEEIRRQFPSVKILLTFFSPSGYEVQKKYPNADIICYLPLDLPHKARAFLSIVNPVKAIFVKYEFWANYLYALERKGIPAYLVSSIFRPKQIFFRKYGGFFRKLLDRFQLICVQDESSKALLESIGKTNVLVSGDTRFDRVVDIAQSTKKLTVVEAFAQNAHVLVAGSTWQHDEELLVRFINNNHEYKMIIVPHEPTKEHVERLCGGLRRSFVLYTKTNSTEAHTADCLVVDTVGLLSSIYRYGQVAYVGGGFGAGIHNTLEAAVWGIPVLFGHNYQRFREAHGLIACSAAMSVNTYRQLETSVNFLFNTPEAGARAALYVKTHTGATDIIIKHVFADLQTEFEIEAN
ncbi:MAG: 3-deoxy-D-manno-octulosonic acid transferase [Prevotellaceae bacterium]|nr:3-deoxy-D-manno-octulosonic acid transferase [Prevotellaceae bacterium]